MYGIPWEDLGTSFAGVPAAASWGSGRLDVFAVSGSNYWHQWYDGGWGTWENLGAPPVGPGSSPAAVGRGWGRVDVFVQGGDTALWRRSYDWYLGGWQPWHSEGGSIRGMPAVASWDPSRWDAFVIGGGGNLYHYWNDGNPHPIENWGKPNGVTLGAGLAATSRGVNMLDVFVRDTNGNIWQMYYNNGGTWIPIATPSGGVLSLAATTMHTDGHVILLSRNSVNQIWSNTYTNTTGWQGWVFKSRDGFDGVGVVSWGPDRMDLFSVRSPDGVLSSDHVEHGYYSSGFWF